MTKDEEEMMRDLVDALRDAAEALDGAAKAGATGAWGRETGWAKLARARAGNARGWARKATDAFHLAPKEIQF